MNIGTLEIQLLANVAKLQSDMDKSKAVVSDTMKQIESAVNMAKQAFVAMTGVAGVDALKGIVLGSIEGIAKLHELSIQAGITVDALTGLAAVGRATGTGADTIAAASNKMSKALSIANEDSKGAAAALKALGLSFDEFQHMSPDERMKKTADALSTFEDGAQKSAAAMLLFGKTGAEMLPFLKDLAQVGELHAKVTTEQAEAAHDFEVKMGQLKANSDAWKKSLALELLPTLNELLEIMLTIKKSTSASGTIIGQGLIVALQTVAVLGLNVIYVFKEMGDTIGGIVAKLSVVGPGFMAANRSIGEAMKKEALDARAALDKQTNAILGVGQQSFDPDSQSGAEDARLRRRKIIKGLGADPTGGGKPDWQADFDKINKQTIESINLYAKELSTIDEVTEAEKARIKIMSEIDASKLLPAQKELFKQRAESVYQMQEEIQRRKDATKAEELQTEAHIKAMTAARSFEDSQSKVIDDLEFQTTLLGKDADAVARLTALRKIDIEAAAAIKGVGDDPQAQLSILVARDQAQKRIIDTLAAQKVAQDALNASWSVGAKNALDAYQKNIANVAAFTQNAFSNAFKGMEDALVSFVTTGKLDFTSLVNSMIADLVRYQIQQSIMKPLMSSLSGKGGGIEVSNGGFLDSALKFLGFANGGQPPVGVPSIVGEKGPELFIPNTPGTVVPNSKLGGGGSQINYAPVISIDSRTDRADVYANVQNALAKNNEAFARMLRQQGVMQ